MQVDLTPTILQLVSGVAPLDTDGRSFAPQVLPCPSSIFLCLFLFWFLFLFLFWFTFLSLFWL